MVEITDAELWTSPQDVRAKVAQAMGKLRARGAG
jgi:hypothetical protein